MAESKAVKSGVTVKDVPADEFIKTLALHLKKTNKIEVCALGRVTVCVNDRCRSCLSGTTS